MPSEWLKGAFIKGGKKMKILEGLVFLDPQIKRARIGYQDQAISILKIIQLHGSQLCQLTIFNVHDLTHHLYTLKILAVVLVCTGAPTTLAYIRQWSI